MGEGGGNRKRRSRRRAGGEIRGNARKTEIREGESGKKGKRDIFTAAIYKMGYDQLNSPILRGTDEGMRYIGCTSSTRKTDAHRTLKYVLIILACRLLLRPSSSSLVLNPLAVMFEQYCSLYSFPRSVFINCKLLNSVRSFTDVGFEPPARSNSQYWENAKIMLVMTENIKKKES